jgi:hypothetical protein
MRSGSARLSAVADARARTRAGNARALAARRAGPSHRAAVAAAAGAGPDSCPGRVTLEGIAAELEARGVPAPGGGRRWSAVAVARVLGALARPWRRLAGTSGASLPPHRAPTPASASAQRR